MRLEVGINNNYIEFFYTLKNCNVSYRLIGSIEVTQAEICRLYQV